MNKLSITALFLLIASVVFGQKWKEEKKESYVLVKNTGGQTLGYSPNSGVKILSVAGFAFKDLNKNGALDPFEDWRLPVDVRAKNLATKLSIQQIAGLMLFSPHQALPARADGYFAGTYNGKPFAESGASADMLTDQQIKFLTKDDVRHVLVTTVKSPEIAAKWNNKIQALVEGMGLGIPANNSSDPRHGVSASAEYDAAAGGEISMWPGSLGMAATFDPSLVEKFGHIAATEYRALGIATALSPQVDIATDPRWSRFNGTFGENPLLAAAMAQAYCDGFQTSTGTSEISNGWGYGSVNAMVKHWPGGGSGEGGRDAHYGIGKFAVYPGNQFQTHLIPFTQGAFKLKGKTMSASAVMPYYTISWNQDIKNKENVGNSYNSYLITDLLRVKYKFDGVACTDWGITGDETSLNTFVGGKSWGVDKLTVAQRHYKALMAGIDQFGGNNESGPIVEAYTMGVKEKGEKVMRARMEQSAVRLLRNIFRVGLFENPYVDPETTKKTVGNPEFMTAGYQAQLKSLVLLKNQKQTLPLKTGLKVYVPKKYTPAGRNFLGAETKESFDYPVSVKIIEKYFTLTENPEEADVALVFIANPNSGIGYDVADAKSGGNGYVPISLQYSRYEAFLARDSSIAGGDPLEKTKNRSYKNKAVTAINQTELGMVNDTRQKMGDKPVIVSITMNNPMVFSEFERSVDAILVNFRVQDQAILDMLVGKAEPSGMLPMQMPLDMQTVEKQAEDVPQDMKCHKDAAGNVYDFGFGMDWKGVIKDQRVQSFKPKAEVK
jgi:beta-glucosidase